MKTKKSYKYISLLIFILSLTVISSINQSFKPQYKLENPKSSAGEIIIITPENQTYFEPMSGYYPALYGFENDDDGSDPAGFNVHEGAGYVNVIGAKVGHAKIIEMYDSVNNDHTELHNTFQPQTSGTVEFWMLNEDVSDTFSIRLLDDTATSVWGDGIGWIQIWQDTLRYLDDTDWQVTTKAISDDTWYHIKIEFECTSGNYHGLAQGMWRFYVDGEMFGDYAFLNDISNVNQIYFCQRGADMSYKCFIDAIGYSWNSTYNIGDNLNEGLLLNFTNTTNCDWIGYSLDGNPNITITGNKVIPLPEIGDHSIILNGITSIGVSVKSELRYFTIGIQDPPIPPEIPSPFQIIPIILTSIGIGIISLLGIALFIFRRKIFSRTRPTIISHRKSQLDEVVDSGSDQFKFCPFCGTRIKKTYQFCANCGDSLKNI